MSEAKKFLKREVRLPRGSPKRGNLWCPDRCDHGDWYNSRPGEMEDKEQLQISMEVADQIYVLFREKVGHTLCSEIHKIRYGRAYRLYVPEESEAFHHMGGHSREGCPEVCGIAARIAAEVIFDLKKNPDLRTRQKRADWRHLLPSVRCEFISQSL